MKKLMKTQSGGLINDKMLDEFVINQFGSSAEIQQTDGIDDYWDAVWVGTYDDDKMYIVNFDCAPNEPLKVTKIEYVGSFKKYRIIMRTPHA